MSRKRGWVSPQQNVCSIDIRVYPQSSSNQPSHGQTTPYFMSSCKTPMGAVLCQVVWQWCAYTYVKWGVAPNSLCTERYSTDGILAYVWHRTLCHASNKRPRVYAYVSSTRQQKNPRLWQSRVMLKCYVNYRSKSSASVLYERQMLPGDSIFHLIR